jgi:hypothetical protein
MYYPKNQIQTGFYSNGELVEINSLTPYTGPYFKTSDNLQYSGKEPNEGKNIQLIPFNELNTTTDLRGPGETNVDPRFTRPNLIYSIITDQKKNNLPYSPTSYYPILTDSEINNGEFIRYFVKKSNENVYMEVNIINFQRSIGSALFLSTPLPWVIRGEKENVRNINAKQIAFVEKNLQIVGLEKFLKYNYLQFYQGR